MPPFCFPDFQIGMRGEPINTPVGGTLRYQSPTNRIPGRDKLSRQVVVDGRVKLSHTMLMSRSGTIFFYLRNGIC